MRLKPQNNLLVTKNNAQETKIKIVTALPTLSLQMQLHLFFTGEKVIFYTMHPVGLHKLFVLFVNGEGTPGKLLDVFIKIQAQILIEHCE